MKTFRRATYQDKGCAYALEVHFKRRMGEMEFRCLVVEKVQNGRCVNREEIYPWRYNADKRKMMRAARLLCSGKKILHVKN
jgi:hypothetical protein